MGTQIKICGVRRLEDADYVNQYMPDYVGFIFWEKSFRYVTPDQAMALRERIHPGIRAVGVFVDAPPEQIAGCAERGIIQVVQLHGNETEERITQLKEQLPEVPVWKAYKVRSGEDIRRAERSAADQILLDNGYGTGECFDHSLIGGIGRDYILAGGLTPENIPEVIGKYHPAMVDISSGVETDGCKDREKIRQAVEAVRAFYDFT